MADIAETLNQRIEQQVPLEDILESREGAETTEGLYSFHPLQTQHPAISDAERFQIMSVGGGGEAAARSMRERGLEVEHRGGMDFSVREPGGEWQVLDPEHRFLDPSTWELADITGDIAGDVGSLVTMGAGAVKGAAMGAPLGPVGIAGGAILGAGVGGGAAQAARTGVGAATGLQPTTREALADITYEAAFGAGSEAVGLAGFGVLKMLGRRWRDFRGGRLTVEELKIRHAVPDVTDPEMRGYWDIAGMQLIEVGPDPRVRGYWDIAGMSGAMGQAEYRAGGAYGRFGMRPRVREWPGKAPIPFAAGRPTGKGVISSRQTYGYGVRELKAKIIHEYFPEVKAAIEGQAKREGKDRIEMAVTFIDDALAAGTNRRMWRLANAVDAHQPEPALFDDLVSAIANGTMTKRTERDIARSLARAWKLDVSDLSDKEISRLLRRRMADDDFVYREAARKLGIQGSFEDTVDLEQLLARIWKYEVARTAIVKASQREIIEAGFEGGVTKTFTKDPPFDVEELGRAGELAPFIRGERYRGERAPIERPPLERPPPAGPVERVSEARLREINAQRAHAGEAPLTRAEAAAELNMGRRSAADVRFEKLEQEADIMDIEYTRRVFGDMPETAGPLEEVMGPFVDVGRRAEQITTRAAGPLGRAKGMAAGGPQGGIVPRAEAVDFWRYLNLEQLRSLKVGGKEIQLTQPQSRMAQESIFYSAISPRSVKWEKRLGRLSSVLQLPRNVRKSVLTALRLKRTADFFSGRGRTGALTGMLIYPGGVGGAVVGAGVEMLGRGASRIARRLMRRPDEQLLRDVIRKAIKQESSRAHRALVSAKQTLDQFGIDGFRAMIYDAMHDPEVREVFDLVAVDQE